MSGILRNRFRKILAVLLFVFILSLLMKLFVITFIFFIGIFTVILNRLTEKKIQAVQKPFSPYSGIRNIEHLIIGDFCNPSEFIPEGRSYIAILAPDRSLNAAFEVFRHTESILDENKGNVIFVCKKRNNNKGLSLFDVPFMAEVTVLQKKLQKLVHKSHYPIFYAPWQSFRFLLDLSWKTNWHEEIVPDHIKDFCMERHILCRYYTGE